MKSNDETNDIERLVARIKSIPATHTKIAEQKLRLAGKRIKRLDEMLARLPTNHRDALTYVIWSDIAILASNVERAARQLIREGN